MMHLAGRDKSRKHGYRESVGMNTVAPWDSEDTGRIYLLSSQLWWRQVKRFWAMNNTNRTGLDVRTTLNGLADVQLTTKKL